MVLKVAREPPTDTEVRLPDLPAEATPSALPDISLYTLNAYLIHTEGPSGWHSYPSMLTGPYHDLDKCQAARRQLMGILKRTRKLGLVYVDIVTFYADPVTGRHITFGSLDVHDPRVPR